MTWSLTIAWLCQERIFAMVSFTEYVNAVIRYQRIIIITIIIISLFRFGLIGSFKLINANH